MSLIRRNPNPTPRQLLVFGLTWLAAFGLLGWRAWFHRQHAGAEFAWIFAAAVPVAGLYDRRVIRRVFLGLSAATYPIGFAVSHVVLALVYYLALTPAGLIMRLFRYDPLSRRFDPRAKSYWIRRNGAKSADSYFRQN